MRWLENFRAQFVRTEKCFICDKEAELIIKAKKYCVECAIKNQTKNKKT